jgi:hypothetical protein
MKILHKLYYKDGGTVEYLTDNDLSFCLDNRILSNTKGKWYLGYPDKPESTMLEDDNLLLIQFLNVLKDFKE